MDDRNMEQQVWQRVFAQNGEQPRNDLRELLRTVMELAGTYRHLAGVLTGKPKERAKQLYEGEMETLTALKGIGILSGRGDEVLKIWNPEKQPGKKLLERCYHRTRSCMVEYTARSAEPEFGAVFQELARQAGKHCTQIAQLIGML